VVDAAASATGTTPQKVATITAPSAKMAFSVLLTTATRTVAVPVSFPRKKIVAFQTDPFAKAFTPAC
jgi:hypothetical protein